MLDKMDKKILNALARNGRASIEVIADSVGLSPTPTRKRVKQLEDAGVIKGYLADIDPEKCGLEMAIYVFVKLQSRDRKTIAEFEQRIMELDEVQRCDLITGGHDYILTLRLPDMKDYNGYLRETLAELPGVFGIETSVVIGNVKNTHQVLTAV
ncbi:Leucine-responsive regulatory protein, regulator for leucine (or lrp) regulon and high-affinity branched-chain amino acid transport system [hydrothermal vent metagenome]|uniref:Leucine-responsive regulatory protein, regulator for leucine (Or lrp) regulon and high-affinity branched-chain amino acid transport system n=1 Tax=hydrothermal vent metagenome TaxID=652676 RepID=A0A3B0S4Y3_9ZZZZ